MTFKFACPHCGQHIAASPTAAHTIGICPTCQSEFEVPEPGPAASSEGPPPLPPPAKNALGLALAALAFSVIPGLGFALRTRLDGGISMAKLTVILGAVSLCCLAGLGLAHWAFARSRHQRFPRVLAVVSLIIGYCSALGLALLGFGLFSGLIVQYKRLPEVPDFQAAESLEPAAPPVPGAPPPQP